MDRIPEERLNELKREIQKKYLAGDYGDYVLMTKLWGCPPSVFEEQTEENILLHKSIFSLELTQGNIDNKREELKRKALQYG